MSEFLCDDFHSLGKAEEAMPEQELGEEDGGGTTQLWRRGEAQEKTGRAVLTAPSKLVFKC